MADSTRKRRRRKTSERPEKPYPEFQLYAHPLGYWSKKIDGRILHFGRWGRVVKGKMEHLPYEAGWKDALKTFKARVDDAHDGGIVESVVRPEKQGDGEPTLADIANKFLTAKMRKMQAGELSPRSFAEYRQATDLLIETFGKTRRPSRLKPEHFESLRAEMSKRWGPARLGKFVVLIRAVFRYAADNNLLRKPVQFGSEFKRPEKPVMRKHKAAGGKKLFTAEEIRMILAALAGEEVSVTDKNGKSKAVKIPSNPPLRAAVLLGVNAALGNTDIAGLQYSHLESRPSWLEYDRQKTGLERRAPLWRETIDAIDAARQCRPKPKSPDDAGCVFLNRTGRRMVQSTTTSHSDYVSTQFRQLLRELKINGRKNLGFYSLRHTAATIGLQTGDRDAVKLLMGHASHDVLSHYDEAGPSDKRLHAVVNHVHVWLFGN